jgi:anti-anti-sigma factor
MKINVTEQEYVAVVAVEGNIMQEYVSLFRSRLADLLERGKPNIILNLAGLSYMSSMCLAAIVDIKNRCNTNGGDVVIACANELVKNLLTITNLNRKIAHYDDLDQAREALQS